MTNYEIWQAVLAEFELKISKANFTTWFRSTGIGQFDSGAVVVCVPNTFTKSWLEKKYHIDIIKALERITGKPVKRVEYRVENIKNVQEQEFSPNTPHTPAVANPTLSLPIERKPLVTEFGLNPKYTFSTFIVGKGSELAHAASQAVAAKPGEAYNPLFIYGGVGLGKTHLLQAIGHTMVANNQHTKILYVSSEKFTNEFVTSVKEGRAKEFKDRYRNVDLLLIDDIQFIGGKEQTQEEFFHTFNALHQYNKQIVLCSDRPPKDIPTLEDRLRSRFEWGMVADIQPPDFETRVAILMNKANSQSLELDMDVAEFVATHIDNNIRELEGALTKVIAHSRLHGQLVDLPLAQDVLGMYISQTQVKVNPKIVLQKTADYFEISYNDIVGTKRSREIVVPRQIAMFIMREELSLSFPRIAKSLGGKDHTTIMHGVSKIRTQSARDSVMSQDIQSIKKILVGK